MSDVIHKTNFEIKESVSTPDYPAGTWLINPTWDPDKATIKAVAQSHRKITGSTVSEMSAAEKLNNPLAGVDAGESGSFKDAVRAATTGALPAHTRSGSVLTASGNGALAAQDGITLTANQRLFVKNEGGGTHLENGPYILATVGDGTHPWKLQRASDCDSDVAVDTCLTVRVQEGTANADTEWYLSTVGPITLNTTALTFTEKLSTPIVLQEVQTQTGAVSTGTTILPADDTIPQNTEGDEYMTLAITPKSATSTLKIDVVCHLSSDADETAVAAAIFKDAVAAALAVGAHTMPLADEVIELTFSHEVASTDTAARTFKVRGGTSVEGTTTFNGSAAGRLYGGVLASSVTITEIEK